MRATLAVIFYAAAFTFIYAAFAGMPDAWEGLNTGWPENPRETLCALLIINGMAAKLMGHIFLLSTTHAK